MTDDGFFSSDWEPTRKWPYWRLTDRQKRPSLDRRQLSIVKDRLIGAEQKIYLFRSIHKQHDGSTQRHIMITELRQEHSSTSQNLLLLLESFCSVSQLCHSNQSLTAPRAPLDTSVDSFARTISLLRIITCTTPLTVNLKIFTISFTFLILSHYLLHP